MVKNEFKVSEFRGSNDYLVKEKDYVVYRNKLYKVLEISKDNYIAFFKLEDSELENSCLEIIRAHLVVALLNEEVEEKIKLCKSEFIQNE